MTIAHSLLYGVRDSFLFFFLSFVKLMAVGLNKVEFEAMGVTGTQSTPSQQSTYFLFLVSPTTMLELGTTEESSKNSNFKSFGLETEKLLVLISIGNSPFIVVCGAIIKIALWLICLISTSWSPKKTLTSCRSVINLLSKLH